MVARLRGAVVKVVTAIGKVERKLARLTQGLERPGVALLSRPTRLRNASCRAPLFSPAESHID